jgi:zinc protease
MLATGLGMGCLLSACAPPRLVAPLRSSAASVAPDAPFRRSLPPPVPVPEVAEDTPHETVLPNGLRVVVVERHGYPVVTTRLIIARSSLDLDDKGSRRVSQASFLYRSGGNEAVRDEISRTAGAFGVSLGDTSSADFLAWSSKGPAGTFETSCSLLARTTFDARLTPQEYERRGAEWRQTSHHGRISLRGAERAVLFGGDHPYGNAGPGETLISMADAESLHRSLYQPNLATLLVVGDIAPERAIAVATSTFGALPAATPVLPRRDGAAPFQSGPKLAVVSHRGLDHRIGAIFARGPAAGTPELDAFALIAHILVGLGSRVVKEVREDMGAAYTVSSPMNRGRAATWLAIEGAYDGDKAVASIRAELDEITRIQAGNVTEEEMQVARERMLAEWRQVMSTVDGAASVYLDAIVLGQPFERARDFPERIARIGRGDIVRVAREYLGADRLHVVFIGEDRWLHTDSLGMGGLKDLVLPR